MGTFKISIRNWALILELDFKLTRKLENLIRSTEVVDVYSIEKKGATLKINTPNPKDAERQIVALVRDYTANNSLTY